MCPASSVLTRHPAPAARPRQERGPAPFCSRRARPPLSSHERAALSGVALALLGFVVHGTRHAVPGTVDYAVTITGLVLLVSRLRTRVLPAPVAYAAAASAALHLGGGLIRVGNGVLYNATPGPELLRYDHVGHGLGTFVGALLVWELLVRDSFAVTRRTGLVTLTTLAALGLGAVNETVEYLATLLRGGTHVGGYTNTGWDLVTNLLAGTLAGIVIHRRRGRVAAEAGGGVPAR